MNNNSKRSSITPYSPTAMDSAIKSTRPPAPETLSDKEMLKEHFYLKQFLHHLNTSANLPTLSNPELLLNIEKENQQLQKQIDFCRKGKREQILKDQLESLGKEAESMMRKMKDFKQIREQEKTQLRQLMTQRQKKQYN